MARSFGGGTDRIVSAVNLPGLTNAYSWACWLNLNGGAGTIRAVFRDGATGASRPSVYIWSDNTFSILGSARNTTAFSPVSGTYCHLGFSGTQDGTGTLIAYANGVQSSTFPLMDVIIDSASVSIGNDNFSQPLNGFLADFAFWNGTLTAAEFLALAKGARPFQIRTANLYHWQPLDGLQSPEPDLSGSAKNGTVTGTTLAAGPPVMLLTPRTPRFETFTAASTTVFRRDLSQLGTRAGARQLHGWSP